MLVGKVKAIIEVGMVIGRVKVTVRVSRRLCRVRDSSKVDSVRIRMMGGFRNVGWNSFGKGVVVGEGYWMV
jgi:hypothetical protein